MKYFIMLLSISTIFSCSHHKISKKEMLPPQKKDWESKIGEVKEFTPEESLLIGYHGALELAARNKKAEACTAMSNLKIEDNEAVSSLYQIRSFELCPYTKEGSAQFSSAIPKFPKWLQAEAYNVLLQQKYSNNDMTNIIKLISEISKQTKGQSNKEDFLKAQIKKLKKLKEKDATSELEALLEEVAPRLKKKPNEDEYLLVAQDFEKIREFTKARKFYKKHIDLKNTAFDQKIDSMKKIAYTYKKEKDFKKFIKELHSIVKLIDKELSNESGFNTTFCQGQKVRYEILLARSYWTQHDTDKTIEMLSPILSYDFATTNDLAIIYNILGHIQLENKKLGSSQRYHQKALLLSKEDSALNIQIQWDQAISYYLSGDMETSSKIFQKLSTDAKEDSDKRKSLFWYARTLQQSGNKQASDQIFESIKQQDPFGYYGIMSTKLLGQQFGPIDFALLKNSRMRMIIPTFEWLKAYKENSLASKFLDSQSISSLDLEDQLSFLSLYHEVETFDSPMSRIFQMDPQTRESALTKAIDLAFPKPYSEIVNKYSKQNKVQSELIYAIMRQESAFNTNARSPADAFGLMQLLPSKGEEIAKKVKIKFSSFTQLYDPEININFGSYELRQLKNDANNDYIMTVAPYNAAIDAVKTWQKDRFRKDPLINIELVPYEETRNYLKLVLRNYIMYMRSNASQPFGFPENIFN